MPNTKTERMIEVMRDYDLHPRAMEAIITILGQEAGVDMKAIYKAAGDDGEANPKTNYGYPRGQ